MKNKELTQQEIQQIKELVDSTGLKDPLGPLESAYFNWIDSDMEAIEPEDVDLDAIFGIQAILDDHGVNVVVLSKKISYGGHSLSLIPYNKRNKKIVYEITSCPSMSGIETKHFESFEEAMIEFASVKDKVVEFWSNYKE